MKRRGVAVAFAVVLAVLGTVGVYAYLRGADKRAASDSTGRTVVVATARIAVGTTWGDAAEGGLAQGAEHAHRRDPERCDRLARRPASATIPSRRATSPPARRCCARPSVRRPRRPACSRSRRARSPSRSSCPPRRTSRATSRPKSQVVVFVTANYHPRGASSSGERHVQRRRDQHRFGRDDQGRRQDRRAGRRPAHDHPRRRPERHRHRDVERGADRPGRRQLRRLGQQHAASASTVQVTLALSQADAQRIINQQKIGELSLALRSADSKVTADDEGYTNTIESGNPAPAQVWAK